MRFLSGYVVHPYSSTNTATAWKKYHFVLLVKSDFHMINDLSNAVHAFAINILTSLSVVETLLPMYLNLSINYRGSSLMVEMASSRLRLMCSFLFVFLWRPVSVAASTRLCIYQ